MRSLVKGLHLAEQIYRDPVGEPGNGEIGEIRAVMADVESGADLAAGPCEQVEPGIGPLKDGGRPRVTAYRPSGRSS